MYNKYIKEKDFKGLSLRAAILISDSEFKYSLSKLI